ncbi:hypothetical protein EsDP_00004610 [Epichloe bromicola]|uniref:Uncharacterized protein n=1 Tax=Epichloe bromicola TaxID=79588 RepID=A0ABQ0CS75_9HYPO
MSPRPSSWTGRPAEHLESPSTTQPSPTDVPQQPSPPTPPAVNRRWMAPCLRAGSGGQPVSSRESWKRPIESLVQRFKRHSLKPNPEIIGNGPDHLDSTALSTEQTTLGLSRLQGDDLMEVDTEPGDQIAGPALPTQRVSKVEDATCISTPHTHIHHQSNQLPAGTLYLLPTPQSQLLPESTSPSILPEIQTALRRGAWSAADAVEDVTTDDAQIDEGYCDDDMDDFAEIDETGHGRSLIRSLANHARSSGVLKYRTSAEAALSCPRVVHRAPRMRRRRQHKQQTRRGRTQQPAPVDSTARPLWTSA